ncbi:lasso peptide biosynthesis B2 protein [Brevundimonas sp.]|uniref:lasso peptide biosynthesis B2 protein n=1 Tax=Brevundimonas sp. TaxID=1871086 RepID=UPI00286B008D|nr:lasso peptide biosynthesis B2 protein [Brevundimonas sp.]
MTPAAPLTPAPAAPPLWCAPGVHLAEVDEDIIVLDLKADAYDCLMGGAGSIRLIEGGGLEVSDPEVREALAAAGIATPTPHRTPRPRLMAPARELPRTGSVSGLGTLQAVTALVIATLGFRGQSLEALIAVDAPGPASTPLDETELDRLVCAVRSARPFVPFQGECLQRSFELRRLLAARGIASDWIFGVRTWPFAAHCWIQIGDLVIGDRLERVRFFTPILAA